MSYSPFEYQPTRRPAAKPRPSRAKPKGPVETCTPGYSRDCYEDAHRTYARSVAAAPFKTPKYRDLPTAEPEHTGVVSEFFDGYNDREWLAVVNRMTAAGVTP